MSLNSLQHFDPESDKPLGGRYKIIQKLGAGGFGQTFLAQDLHLPGHPRCVVKQLKPQVSSAEELQVATRLFDTEANVLYRLGSHPQIPRLLAHFQESAEFYLAQELIEGHSLNDELVAATPWHDHQAIAFLGDILSTLTFVHGNRVIHRDIKPSNLIRRHSDNRIVLIDFGAVKQVSTQIMTSKMGGISHTISIGTQGYMPNEQIAGRPQFSSDVYAVGMIAIQALTGYHPSTIPLHPQTGELDWHALVPRSHPTLIALLDYMVRYDFRTRYATAAEALNALESLPPELSQFIPPLVGVNPEANPQLVEPAAHYQQSPASPYQPSPSMAVQTLAVGRPSYKTEVANGIRQASTAPGVRPSRASQQKFFLIGAGAATLLGLFGLTWRVFTAAPTTESATTVSEELPSSSAQETPLFEADAEAIASPPQVDPLPEAEADPDTLPSEASDPDSQSEDIATEASVDENLEAAVVPTQPEEASTEVPSDEEPVDEASMDEEPTDEEPIDESSTDEDPETTVTLTPEAAETTVVSAYDYVADQAWDAARSLYSGDAARQFDPDFYQGFQRITVENLRVNSQTAEAIELIGQNTYIYFDGSTQQEERTFTVQIIDGQPHIVSTAFVRVTKARSD